MYNKKLTSKEILEKLLEVAEYDFRIYGTDNLKLMATDMYNDKEHPSWRWI